MESKDGGSTDRGPAAFCALCNRNCESLFELSRHESELLHHIKLEQKTRKCKHECKICNKTLDSLTAYSQHTKDPFHQARCKGLFHGTGRRAAPVLRQGRASITPASVSSGSATIGEKGPSAACQDGSLAVSQSGTAAWTRWSLSSQRGGEEPPLKKKTKTELKGEHLAAAQSPSQVQRCADSSLASSMPTAAAFAGLPADTSQPLCSSSLNTTNGYSSEESMVKPQQDAYPYPHRDEHAWLSQGGSQGHLHDGHMQWQSRDESCWRTFGIRPRLPQQVGSYASCYRQSQPCPDGHLVYFRHERPGPSSQFRSQSPRRGHLQSCHDRHRLPSSRDGCPQFPGDGRVPYPRGEHWGSPHEGSVPPAFGRRPELHVGLPQPPYEERSQRYESQWSPRDVRPWQLHERPPRLPYDGRQQLTVESQWVPHNESHGPPQRDDRWPPYGGREWPLQGERMLLPCSDLPPRSEHSLPTRSEQFRPPDSKSPLPSSGSSVWPWMQSCDHQDQHQTKQDVRSRARSFWMRESERQQALAVQPAQGTLQRLSPDYANGGTTGAVGSGTTVGSGSSAGTHLVSASDCLLATRCNDFGNAAAKDAEETLSSSAAQPAVSGQVTHGNSSHRFKDDGRAQVGKQSQCKGKFHVQKRANAICSSGSAHRNLTSVKIEMGTDPGSDGPAPTNEAKPECDREQLSSAQGLEPSCEKFNQTWFRQRNAPALLPCGKVKKLNAKARSKLKRRQQAALVRAAAVNGQSGPIPEAIIASGRLGREVVAAGGQYECEAGEAGASGEQRQEVAVGNAQCKAEAAAACSECETLPVGEAKESEVESRSAASSRRKASEPCELLSLVSGALSIKNQLQLTRMLRKRQLSGTVADSHGVNKAWRTFHLDDDRTLPECDLSDVSLESLSFDAQRQLDQLLFEVERKEVDQQPASAQPVTGDDADDVGVASHFGSAISLQPSHLSLVSKDRVSASVHQSLPWSASERQSASERHLFNPEKKIKCDTFLPGDRTVVANACDADQMQPCSQDVARASAKAASSVENGNIVGSGLPAAAVVAGRQPRSSASCVRQPSDSTWTSGLAGSSGATSRPRPPLFSGLRKGTVRMPPLRGRGARSSWLSSSRRSQRAQHIFKTASISIEDGFSRACLHRKARTQATLPGRMNAASLAAQSPTSGSAARQDPVTSFPTAHDSQPAADRCLSGAAATISMHMSTCLPSSEPPTSQPQSSTAALASAQGCVKNKEQPVASQLQDQQAPSATTWRSDHVASQRLTSAAAEATVSNPLPSSTQPSRCSTASCVPQLALRTSAPQSLSAESLAKLLDISTREGQVRQALAQTNDQLQQMQTKMRELQANLQHLSAVAYHLQLEEASLKHMRHTILTGGTDQFDVNTDVSTARVPRRPSGGIEDASGCHSLEIRKASTPVDVYIKPEPLSPTSSNDAAPMETTVGTDLLQDHMPGGDRNVTAAEHRMVVANSAMASTDLAGRNHAGKQELPLRMSSETSVIMSYEKNSACGEQKDSSESVGYISDCQSVLSKVSRQDSGSLARSSARCRSDGSQSMNLSADECDRREEAAGRDPAQVPLVSIGSLPTSKGRASSQSSAMDKIVLALSPGCMVRSAAHCHRNLKNVQYVGSIVSGQGSVMDPSVLNSSKMPCVVMTEREFLSSTSADEMDQARRAPAVKLEDVGDTVTGNPCQHQNDTPNDIQPRPLEDRKSCPTIHYVGHSGAVLDMTVRGGCLYTASYDKTVRKFDLKTGNALMIFAPHRNHVKALRVLGSLQQGYQLYTATVDGLLTIFNTLTGEALETHDLRNPIMCMSDAWGMLFLGLASGTMVCFQTKMSTIVSTFSCSTESVLCLANGTEGGRRVVYVGSLDGTVTQRDARSGLLLRTLHLPPGLKPTVLLVSEEEPLIYVAAMRSHILAFSSETGQQVLSMPLECRGGRIKNAVLLPGKRMLAASTDSIVRLIDLQRKTIINVYYGDSKNILLAMCSYTNTFYTGYVSGQVLGQLLSTASWPCHHSNCTLTFGWYDHLQCHFLADHTESSSDNQPRKACFNDLLDPSDSIGIQCDDFGRTTNKTGSLVGESNIQDVDQPSGAATLD